MLSTAADRRREGTRSGEGNAAGSRRRRPAPHAAPTPSMAARTLSLHDMAHGAPSRRHAPAPGRGFLRAPGFLIGPATPRGALSDWLVVLPVRRRDLLKAGKRGVGFVFVCVRVCARARGGRERASGARPSQAVAGRSRVGFCTRGLQQGRLCGGGGGGGILQAVFCTPACVGRGLRAGGCTVLGGGGCMPCCVTTSGLQMGVCMPHCTGVGCSRGFARY